MKTIYLDNGATTKVDEDVVKSMTPFFSKKYGNASSSHRLGQDASMALEESRAIIAKKIKAKPEEIIFTSCGTESNNTAIKGIAFQMKKQGKGNHIITSKIEHPSVYNACEFLERNGFKVTYLDVNSEGFISLEELENTIKKGRDNEKNTILVTIMAANNEIGTIHPIKEIGKICSNHNIIFHSDCVQALGKTPIDVKSQNISLASFSAHKLHGPKGIGALFIKGYLKENKQIEKLMEGGPQEMDLRPGTENIPYIVGFAKAISLCKDKHIKEMEKLRDMFINGILNTIPDARLNGPRKSRLCNNVNFSFKYIEGEALGGYLDAKGICTSTGSACSAKQLKPSRTLLAIGLSPEDAHGSQRFTLSRYTTKEEIEQTIKATKEVVEKLRKISPFKPK